jgi:hypothetical protein
MVRGEIGLDIVHSIKLLLNQHIEVKIKQITPAYTIVQKTIKLLYNRKDRVRTVLMVIYNNNSSRSKYRFCVWYMQQSFTIAPCTITAKRIYIYNTENIHRFHSSKGPSGSMS